MILQHTLRWSTVEWITFRMIVAAASLAVVLCGASPARAAPPRLETNQDDVEDVTRASALDIDDPVAVLGFVLAALPDRVKVYPPENYYYFRFVHGGVRYAGNLRPAAAGAAPTRPRPAAISIAIMVVRIDVSPDQVGRSC